MRCCVEHLPMDLWAGGTAVSHEQAPGVSSHGKPPASLGQYGAGQGDSYLEAVDDKGVTSEHPLQRS